MLSRLVAIASGGPHRVARHGRSFAALPTTMRAAMIRETGPSSVMKVETVPVPELKPGQVLVRNEYAGLNFIDTYHRSGLYARDLPFIGGQEGAGIVAAVSPEAEKFCKVGDRVAYTILQTYSEYAAVPGAKIIPVADAVPLDVATACMVQGLTAHYLTHSAHADLIKPGEWMLIHGTGSGACQWAAQIAKIKGYKVIGTCAKNKEAIARATGVDELIVLDEVPGTSYEDYTSQDIVKQVMEITNGVGVHAVIDGIGKATYEIALNSLAARGIFVSFGNASGAVPAYPPLKHIGKSSYMTRPKLLEYTRTREELLWRSEDLWKWISEGTLRVTVDKTFPLSRVSEGHDYLEAGKSTGKVVYKIDE